MRSAWARSMRARLFPTAAARDPVPAQSSQSRPAGMPVVSLQAPRCVQCVSEAFQRPDDVATARRARNQHYFAVNLNKVQRVLRREGEALDRLESSRCTPSEV